MEEFSQESFEELQSSSQVNCSTFDCVLESDSNDSSQKTDIDLQYENEVTISETSYESDEDSKSDKSRSNDGDFVPETESSESDSGLAEENEIAFGVENNIPEISPKNASDNNLNGFRPTENEVNQTRNRSMVRSSLTLSPVHLNKRQMLSHHSEIISPPTKNSNELSMNNRNSIGDTSSESLQNLSSHAIEILRNSSALFHSSSLAISPLNHNGNNDFHEGSTSQCDSAQPTSSVGNYSSQSSIGSDEVFVANEEITVPQTPSESGSESPSNGIGFGLFRNLISSLEQRSPVDLKGCLNGSSVLSNSPVGVGDSDEMKAFSFLTPTDVNNNIVDSDSENSQWSETGHSVSDGDGEVIPETPSESEEGNEEDEEDASNVNSSEDHQLLMAPVGTASPNLLENDQNDGDDGIDIPDNPNNSDADADTEPLNGTTSPDLFDENAANGMQNSVEPVTIAENGFLFAVPGKMSKRVNHLNQ